MLKTKMATSVFMFWEFYFYQTNKKTLRSCRLEGRQIRGPLPLWNRSSRRTGCHGQRHLLRELCAHGDGRAQCECDRRRGARAGQPLPVHRGATRRGRCLQGPSRRPRPERSTGRRARYRRTRAHTHTDNLDIFSGVLRESSLRQLSSASGRGRPALGVWLSLWKDRAGRRSPSTTTKTAPVGSPTWPRSQVGGSTAWWPVVGHRPRSHAAPVFNRRLRDLCEVQRAAHPRQPLPGARRGSGE